MHRLTRFTVIPYISPIMHRGKQSHAGQVDRCDKPHLIIKDLKVNGFEHKKWKKNIYMVTVLVIESLSIAQKHQELQVVTTDYTV